MGSLVITQPPTSQPFYLPCFPPESAHVHLLHPISISCLYYLSGQGHLLYSFPLAKWHVFSKFYQTPFPLGHSSPRLSSPHCIPITILSVSHRIRASHLLSGTAFSSFIWLFSSWGHRMHLVSLSPSPAQDCKWEADCWDTMVLLQGISQILNLISPHPHSSLWDRETGC